MQPAPDSDQIVPAPTAELERRELTAVIDEEILRLPSRYRAAVVLCYLEGLSHEEAARRLGCPLGTVNSRLATARQRLGARLLRRGLAPAALPIGGAIVPGAAQGAVPSPLLHATLQASLRLANGYAPAGPATAKVALLTQEFFRATIAAKLRIVALATGILAAGVAVAGAGLLGRAAPASPPNAAIPGQQPTTAAPLPPRRPPAEPQTSNPPHSSQPDQGAFGPDTMVRVAGKILMPDGSPAAGAIVETTTGTDEPPIITHTSNTGAFELHGVFGNGVRIHASSADGKLQTMLVLSSGAARTDFAAPVKVSPNEFEVKTPPIAVLLAPALTHDVIVASDGQPVEGARVVGGGQRFSVRGVTGPDGRATLQFPVGEQLRTLVAWHAKLGVNGVRSLEGLAAGGTTTLGLKPPRPLAIRVVDGHGKAVGGMNLDVSVRTEDSDWIGTGEIPEASVRTDAMGMAILPWPPREKLQYVDVGISSPDWKVEKKDLTRLDAGLVTVQATPRQVVLGRLVMPRGENAAGVLITGFGIGPKGGGDIPYARAQRDGTFAAQGSRGL